jgi:hypothetical protein
MTWNEFKDKVDAALRLTGRDGSVPIEYISIKTHAGENVELWIEPQEPRLQIWNAASAGALQPKAIGR